MRRREFIVFVGCAAVERPLAARAERAAKPVIGYLHLGSFDSYAAMISAFRYGLKEAGYVEGQNVSVEYRFAEGQAERLPELVADLLQHNVSVIATGGGDLPARAAQQASGTIPIVFVTSDPVASHLVASLNRPGANLTGVSLFTVELGPKRFGLLRELVPHADLVAVLLDPTSGGAGESVGSQVEDAARAVGQKIQVLKADTAQQIDEAFDTITQIHADGLIIVSSPFFTNSRHQIVALANHARIPAIYPLRQYVLAGGLLSYGSSIIDAYRRSGDYTGRILKGAKPNDLPIQQPTEFDLIVNLKTAKSSGIAIPPTLLARADEVIE
jgi:putative tryptophan/tyrosine transport system substrate-binding protein